MVHWLFAQFFLTLIQLNVLPHHTLALCCLWSPDASQSGQLHDQKNISNPCSRKTEYTSMRKISYILRFLLTSFIGLYNINHVAFYIGRGFNTTEYFHKKTVWNAG